MEYLRGIVVRLKTGGSKQAGTDDPLFLGVAGAAGGREFPLDVAWFDDAQRGSDVKYAFGEVWEEAARVGARQPRMAATGWNDPTLSYLGFQAIDRVYLRKHAGRRASDDDAYQLDRIEVALYGDPGHKREFRCTTALWLGLQYGLQIWIAEV